MVTIYHNPACGTSRKVLGLIREHGIEPRIVDYLKTPLDRAGLARLIDRLGIGARGLLRRRGTPYAELGLDDPSLDAATLIERMVEHPILIERPIVETALGARLCRPPETVLAILPTPRPDDGTAGETPAA